MKKTPFLFLALWATVSCFCQTAADKKSSEIHLTGKNEPGKPFTLEITVLDIKSKQPVPNVEVFAYHTNHKGDYERDAANVARIHGTAYSDGQGKVRFHTIYPRGYNDSPHGAHIHFVIKSPAYNYNNHAELGFDDYSENKYDRNNLKPTTVYLDTLEEKNNAFAGKATIYIPKS